MVRHWQPTRDEFTASVRGAAVPPVRLDRFSRGIDNARIDVTLSRELLARASTLVRRILGYECGRQKLGPAATAPEWRDFEAFGKVYEQLTERAIDRARKTSRPELLQLFQLAVWQFLLRLVENEIDRLREQLQAQSTRGQQKASSRALQAYQQRVGLAKERPNIDFRIRQRVFRQLQKLESLNLRRLRASILGIAWPLPKELLFNPLLQMHRMSADEQFMHSYPLLLTDRNPGFGFRQCNELVVARFKEYLPEWAVEIPAPTGKAAACDQAMQTLGERGVERLCEVQRLLVRALPDAEYQAPRFCWLDVPENMDLILRPASPLGELRGAEFNELAEVWRQDQWRRFRRLILQQLFQDFRRSGLLRRIVASYAVPRVHRELSAKLGARDIFGFLSGDISARQLRKQLLASQVGAAAVELLVKGLRVEGRRLRRMGVAEHQEHFALFLRDFSRFRRDLKFAHIAYRAMSRIRLLNDDAHINLSQANGTLQEFALPAETAVAEKPVQRHVVIKADVRGSSAVTSQLVGKNLNPASYFSLTFFGPINQLIEEFGAVKTFIEGDAVILTVFDHGEVAIRSLSVAQACGLARKILEVVDAQNIKNREYGLPDLELGLGIVFAEGSPTFLYDGDRQIMISPAINRADRLSSCAAELRRSELHARLKGRGLSVVAVPGQGRGEDGGDGKLLRYNVNGIELDAPAFVKLRLELELRQVVLQSGESRGLYHVGRYPDRIGRMHWLVVREAPIRIRVGNDFSSVEQQGRRFYEVIADRQLIAQLVGKLKQELAEGKVVPISRSRPA